MLGACGSPATPTASTPAATAISSATVAPAATTIPAPTAALVPTSLPPTSVPKPTDLPTKAPVATLAATSKGSVTVLRGNVSSTGGKAEDAIVKRLVGFQVNNAAAVLAGTCVAEREKVREGAAAFFMPATAFQKPHQAVN